MSESPKALLRRLGALPCRTEVDGLKAALSEAVNEDAVFKVCAPFDELRGAEELAERLWLPLKEAFPDLERRDDVVIAGGFEPLTERDRGAAGGEWAAGMGHYLGTFERPWLGIPPTGRPAYLRFGEFVRFEDGKAVESLMILDIPELMHQAGLNAFPPPLGAAILIPAPAPQDGLVPDGQDAAETEKSLNLVNGMLLGLGDYDGQDKKSMGQTRFWHPDFMWYGPGGIGTTRGLKGFENQHQLPFLQAFPDRKGGHHDTRFAEGRYCASGGWPSMTATHTGGGWMGLPPTGRPVTMRVMDFWRREGDLLVENWVFIDMIDLLRQMGLDLFERMNEMARPG